MITKTFEIRDRLTFLPALAIRLEPGSEADRFILGRAGFGTSSDSQGVFILLIKLTDNKTEYGSAEWNDRTMTVAHRFIDANFDDLESGSVIDVEYILGETKEPKKSERQ
jgi:hypothetical protein